jgi:hypothetical protein
MFHGVEKCGWYNDLKKNVAVGVAGVHHSEWSIHEFGTWQYFYLCPANFKMRDISVLWASTIYLNKLDKKFEPHLC